ncbi:MAG TPA: uracil-DNA glycosylase [Solirubrobacterales bacterium]|nr:uracil-DNA glycosylase [Solirubrobacterales bacterium]
MAEVEAATQERVEAAADAAGRRAQLVDVYKRALECESCPLAATRTKVVFGSGNSDADLMFVGEAPGAEEDRRGLPFVGRAGNFLAQLLEGIGMKRDDVFINNVLMCRPPGNRDPQPDEIEHCRPWLEQRINLIQPRVIATLGNFATKLITANPTGITKVRGTPQEHTLGGRQVYVLPLFHPAAGLRTPRVAEQLREDFAAIPELLARPLPEPPPSIAQADPGEEAGPPPADQLGFFG